MKINSQERKDLLLQIGKAFDTGNEELAVKLGRVLRDAEEPAIRRGYYDVSDYSEKDIDNKLSKITTTVYKVTHLSSGLTYYSTFSELCKARNLTFGQGYQLLRAKKDYIFTPIAEVFNEVINQVVFVSDGRKVIEFGFYLDVAINYGIHFEDLHEAIEDKTEIKIENNKYKFSYADGKEH